MYFCQGERRPANPPSLQLAFVVEEGAEERKREPKTENINNKKRLERLTAICSIWRQVEVLVGVEFMQGSMKYGCVLRPLGGRS
jgi:hypothetical protein